VLLVTPPTSTVLVLSSQPLVAALLGMLLDLLGYRPVFAADGERPEDALQRQHPLFAVLIDGETEAAVSDAFFARAAQGRLGLAFFGVRGRTPALARLARDRGVPWFEVPLELQELSRAVEMAAASDWWRRRGERRASPGAAHADDGGLVFVDPVGRRWCVYDRRRGVDRRGSGEAEVQRVFVNDAGEEWTYRMAAQDVAGSGASGDGDDPPRLPSPAELQRQLELAVRVERGD
jgi:hypothetical protein